MVVVEDKADLIVRSRHPMSQPKLMTIVATKHLDHLACACDDPRNQQGRSDCHDGCFHHHWQYSGHYFQFRYQLMTIMSESKSMSSYNDGPLALESVVSYCSQYEQSHHCCNRNRRRRSCSSVSLFKL